MAGGGVARRGGGDAEWLATVPLAHRGLHGPGVPENSMAAFAAARDAGVGVELDVRLSADGRPVVFHDRTLARMTGQGGTVADRATEDLAAARLDGTDEGIPTLAEVLGLMDGLPVMVEVKAESIRPTALEPAVAAVLEANDGPTCIASFNPMSVRWFRRHSPSTTRVLTASPTVVDVGGRVRRLPNLATVGLVDPAAISYAVVGLDLPVVQRHREAGGVVVTWTVRTTAELATARHLADNVIFEALPVDVVRD